MCNKLVQDRTGSYVGLSLALRPPQAWNPSFCFVQKFKLQCLQFFSGLGDSECKTSHFEKSTFIGLDPLALVEVIYNKSKPLLGNSAAIQAIPTGQCNQYACGDCDSMRIRLISNSPRASLTRADLFTSFQVNFSMRISMAH